MANEGKPTTDTAAKTPDTAAKPTVPTLRDTMSATTTIVNALEPFQVDQRRTILQAAAAIAGVRTQGAPRQNQQPSQQQPQGRGSR